MDAKNYKEKIFGRVSGEENSAFLKLFYIKAQPC